MTDFYPDALNEIYQSYMAVKDRIKGKHDHTVRQPERIIDLARKLEVIPPPDKIIRITGSKGKGTSSRLVAKYLQTQTGKKTGLVVSPEEFDHTDRMSINGRAITREEFAAIYNQLRPHLQSQHLDANKLEYFSPSGIFLLIALLWFKQQAVEYYVLETGRGVIRDECGLIPSKISIVTSILYEHPTELGPTLDDIAREKLSIGNNSDWVAISPQAQTYFKSTDFPAHKIIAPNPAQPIRDLPHWIWDNTALAKSAVAKFLDMRTDDLSAIDFTNISASFGYTKIGGIPAAYEAIINLDSLDQNLWKDWQKKYSKIHVLASFPDDKDRDRLLDFFHHTQVAITEVALHGTRGYLHYKKTLADGNSTIQCAYDDPAQFRASAQTAIGNSKPDFIYAAGTQTFIRLFKKSFA